MKAGQIRAARALLNWSQGDLVEKSGLSLTTIRRMEDERIGPDRSSAGNVNVVTQVFRSAGIAFLEPGEIVKGGYGLRLSTPAGGGKT